MTERRKIKIKTKLRAGNKRQDSGVTERQRQLTAEDKKINEDRKCLLRQLKDKTKKNRLERQIVHSKNLGCVLTSWHTEKSL